MQAPDDKAMLGVADERLANGALAGDRECFAQLVKRYYSNLLNFIAGRVASVSDAEDIVQDAFLNAYKSMHTFDTRYSFKTWLFCIAHNCMVSHFRRKKPIPVECADQVSCEDDQQGRAEDADDARAIWDLARQLKPDQFTALWLRYNEQMEIKEISRSMGKSAVHVRVLLHRARGKLSDIIKSDNNGLGGEA